MLVPAGSRLVGHVTSVNRASRTDRKGSLTVEFNRLSVNGRSTDVRATVVEALESGGLKDEVGRVGAGAGVGAIIGGILGGVKGAVAGILIGAGGVLVATEGKDVDLPPGTLLRVRFDTPVHLTFTESARVRVSVGTLSVIPGALHRAPAQHRDRRRWSRCCNLAHVELDR